MLMIVKCQDAWRYSGSTRPEKKSQQRLDKHCNHRRCLHLNELAIRPSSCVTRSPVQKEPGWVRKQSLKKHSHLLWLTSQPKCWPLLLSGSCWRDWDFIPRYTLYAALPDDLCICTDFIYDRTPAQAFPVSTPRPLGIQSCTFYSSLYVLHSSRNQELRAQPGITSYSFIKTHECLRGLATNVNQKLSSRSSAGEINLGLTHTISRERIFLVNRNLEPFFTQQSNVLLSVVLERLWRANITIHSKCPNECQLVLFDK